MHPTKTGQATANAIRSHWWRRPLEALFPDKAFDGQLQNPGTEQVFDFDDLVMQQSDPLGFIEQHIVYVPPGDEPLLTTIFIPGLGQTGAMSSQRSRRYAERLNTGIANLNNGSYLKQNPLLKRINPFLDWLEAAIHRLGLSGSPAIENCARLIVLSLACDRALNLSADSHGTILLGRALRTAKHKFVLSHTSFWNLKGRRHWEKRWEERAGRLLNVMAFGNGYRAWVKGPKYVMVFINGDVLPAKIGLTPQNSRQLKRNDIQFLVFEAIFEDGNFEAHNMMYTIELIRETFLRNGLRVGDFTGLYRVLSEGSLNWVTAAEAKSDRFPWPQDMQDYTWEPGGFLKMLGRDLG